MLFGAIYDWVVFVVCFVVESDMNISQSKSNEESGVSTLRYCTLAVWSCKPSNLCKLSKEWDGKVELNLVNSH